MLPDAESALNALALAEKLNPGAWIQHSKNVGIAARNIAERINGLESEKAYVLGLLHDIGRRVGVVGVARHIWEGYCYCVKNGWDEVARICMTHSFPLAGRELSIDTQEKEIARIREYVLGCEYDDYDLLIQLCDNLATSKGFCILEKRFVDVARRHGAWPNMIDYWNAVFEIKKKFELRMNGSIYGVLPDIAQTSLLDLSV